MDNNLHDLILQITKTDWLSNSFLIVSELILEHKCNSNMYNLKSIYSSLEWKS